MLDQQYQIDAFYALRAAGGLKTPESITLYQSSITQINRLVDATAALTPDSIRYPAAIRPLVSRLDAISEDLLDSVKQIKEVIKLLQDQSDPSALLTIQIGWEVYCRFNELTANPAIVAFIADTELPQSILTTLTSLSTADLNASFAVLNNTVIAGEGTPLFEVPADVLDAAVDAITEFEGDVQSYQELLVAVEREKQAALTSIQIAMSYFQNGVTVSILDTLSHGTFVAPAVACIVPQTVLYALAAGTVTA
ncbi:hypothetical protein PC510_003883 [Escherichia coli]|uniref:hypothetical protein n=1 Tax=Escherichia coli TaxID=562 RepID=UPI001858AED4|nr:hypothetical protein [Escherichia coli]EKI3096602.1 hypothetical protein [Escherichia coli]MBB9841306.1 hypothetical protein [Escherichia coli]